MYTGNAGGAVRMETPTASVNCAVDRIVIVESVVARSKEVRIFFMIEVLRFKRRLVFGERFFGLISIPVRIFTGPQTLAI